MSVEKVIMVAQEEFLRKQVAKYLRKKRIDVAECGTNWMDVVVSLITRVILPS